MRAPTWALKIVQRECERAGRPIAPLNWRHSQHEGTSGQTGSTRRGAVIPWDRITITAGTDRDDQKRVVLHELGHWITRHGHDEVFYRKVYELYRRYRPRPMAELREAEKQYKPGLVAAYWPSRRKR